MTSTPNRIRSRAFATLALGLFLGLGTFDGLASAQAQKEVTDGFFDVPPRDPSEETPPWGLPAYLITSGMGGLAMFILCKSARRS